MVYIIFGLQEAMIKNQINKAKSVFFGDSKNDNMIEFRDSYSLYDVVDECNQFSLTNDKKCVLVKNASFLTNERNKNKINDEKELGYLLDYIRNDNPDCLLILTTVYESLNEKSNIVKEVKNKGKIIELKELTNADWPIYIGKYFEKKEIKISEEAINELAFRSQNDLNIFQNEVTKLILYKDYDITLDDVKLIVTKPIDENAFDLVNALLKNNKEEALNIFNDLKIQKVEPITLISMLGTSLIFYDKVALANEKSSNYYEIATLLQANPYRVKMTLSQLNSLKIERIRKALDDLYQLDKDIKHSNVDRYYAFEMFIINF